MHWLEIIEVRTTKSNRDSLAEYIQGISNEINNEFENQTLRVYFKVLVESNISIHLFHESVNADNRGSVLGLRLASMLKEFGMVHHHIWIDMQSI